MFGKKKIAQLVAEFLGVSVLALAVYTIMARTSFPLFSGLAAGAVVGLFTLIMGSVSGAHLNPAITIGIWSVRRIQTLKAVVYLAAQMLGGVAAWYLLKYFLGHSLQTIAGAQFEWKVFVAEAVGAGVFGFGYVAALAEKLEGGKLAGAISLSLFAGILVASLGANAVLNPAVAVGIQSWSVAYATAPLLGAFVGMQIHKFLFDASEKPAKAKATVSVSTAEVAKAKSTRKKAAPKKKAAPRRKK